MKNLEKRERDGFLNRHTDGLPKEKAIIKITIEDCEGEQELLCEWKSFCPKDYKEEDMPAKGYQGTARVVESKHKGIGFHAWTQNNSEFIYYKIV